MNNFRSENLLEELDKGLGEGPLTLQIFCCDCNEQYKLNKESVALAFATKATFADYVRFVQSSKCRGCEEKKLSITKKII